MRLFVPIVLLVAAIASPQAAAAQARATGADIEGTTTDPSGAVVVGAAISVTNIETNISRRLTTDGTGRYYVPALDPGVYEVQVSQSGFTTQKLERVILSLGQAVTIDFSLKIASATERVDVLADVPLVEVSRSALSSVVNQQQIDSLPINGRNFISFSIITPGVTIDHTPQQGTTTTSGLSFTGQRARANNVMVDGLDNNDLVVGAVRATFSQEAIREFQVLADSYSAEFGKASGGVVNIVTKSGTNTTRGDGYLYFRDSGLNAKNYFDEFDIFGNPINLAKGPYSQKQWGFTLGGPIKTNRTFYFLSQERTDLRDNRVVTIDPAAAAILNTAGFAVDLGNVPLTVKNDEVFGKLDHYWSPVRSFVARISVADITREGIDDVGGTVARSRGTVQLRKDWSVSAAETDMLSRTWLNEFRTQFAYENQAIDALDPSCGSAGCTTSTQGGPTLEIAGVASVGRQRLTPQLRLNKRLQLLDTLSHVSGTNVAKVGVEYNHIAFPGSGNALPLQFGGRYIFSAIPALGLSTALDGLRLGVPAAYVQGYGNEFYSDYGYQDLSLFAQDELQIGRLVVKPGVRYQRQFWQDATYAVSDVGGGTFSYQTPSDPTNIAPRIGVAYNVAGNGLTIVHGSYGMFYNNMITGLMDVGRLINGSATGVRTLTLTAPRASLAWNSPNHRLTEEQAVALLGGQFPSLGVVPDPSLKNGYAHQLSVGVDRLISRDLAVSVNGVTVRGFNEAGVIDYNPVLPSRLGPSRRPDDRPCSVNPAAACVNGGIPGTSASVLQYTSFGESWYEGVTVALNKRLTHNYQFLLSYTLSKAEDTTTDFQSNFIPQNNGFGRNPADKSGLPLGFDPASERGPSTQDQRHRFVLSGVYQFPTGIQLSGILTAASGRPYTPFAGADLNGDGNGGASFVDRARVNPLDESTAVSRNSETTAAQCTVDLRVSRTFRIRGRASLNLIVEAFNLFNRVNFIEDTNQSSFAIFGAGAYPSSPLPTYGRYTLTLPPRQVQLAAKMSF